MEPFHWSGGKEVLGSRLTGPRHLKWFTCQLLQRTLQISEQSDRLLQMTSIWRSGEHSEEQREGLEGQMRSQEVGFNHNGEWLTWGKAIKHFGADGRRQRGKRQSYLRGETSLPGGVMTPHSREGGSPGGHTSTGDFPNGGVENRPAVNKLEETRNDNKGSSYC